MQTLKISALDELQQFLGRCGPECLYRGQTKHYVDAHDRPHIPTTFDRHGCIPPIMFEWTHYSNALLRAFTGLDYHSIETGISQAILQHYGWRSFFVDLTKSTSVACWFAANQYTEHHHMEVCEDFEENPVCLIHRRAFYEESDDPGHLYVVDSSHLKQHGSAIHDLTAFDVAEGVLRFNAQSACLVDGHHGKLRHSAITAHLIVEHSVLVDYYQAEGITNVTDLFPDREQDFILKSLLDIPWEKVHSPRKPSIPFFRRGLDLPEYDHKYIKHLGTRPTLFSGFWIADNRGDEDSPLAGIPFYRMPKQAYYANTNEGFDLSEVSKRLKNHGSFAVELDGLIKIPELGDSVEFEKGIMVEALEDGCVSVSALMVEHPGHLVAGLALNQGWVYKPQGSTWTKQEHVDQCPCNNALRHTLQFSILRYLNESIKDRLIQRQDALNFWHSDARRP